MARRPVLSSSLLLYVASCVHQVSPRPPTPQPSATATPTRSAEPEYRDGRQPSAERIPVDRDDAVWGAPNAPVTIVAFTDLECPYCSRAASTLDSLKRQYGPQRLRVVLKHNPLPFHRSARRAAEVTQAVRELGGSERAFAFVSLAYVAQDRLASEPYATWIQQLGMDAEKVLARATAPNVKAAIDGDMALAASLGDTGTPAFRINGRSLSGALPLEEFTKLVDAELAATEALGHVPPEARYAERVRANWTEAPAPSPTLAEDMTVYKVPVEGAPARGPAAAPVTIVAFVDYECPFSKRVLPTLDALIAAYPNDLRLVVRHNPLSFHPRATPAARLALEARARGGDVLFFKANQRLLESTSLDDASLLTIASELGMNESAARAALASDRHDRVIWNDQRLAARVGATGTPHFFVNGVRLSGAQPLETFKALVDDRLEAARQSFSNGVAPAQIYAEILRVGSDPPPPERVVVPASPNAPARGPRHAPITIENFTDLQCPFCARGSSTLDELQRRYPGKIRVVFRHLPLPFHERARPAARVALRARQLGGDEAFFRVVADFYRDQNEPDAFSDARIRSYAERAGVGAAELAAAASDSSLDAAIDADVAAARAAGIQGTPSFVVNGYLVRGAQPAAAFENVIEYSNAQPTRTR